MSKSPRFRDAAKGISKVILKENDNASLAADPRQNSLKQFEKTGGRHPEKTRSGPNRIERGNAPCDDVMAGGRNVPKRDMESEFFRWQISAGKTG